MKLFRYLLLMIVVSLYGFADHALDLSAVGPGSFTTTGDDLTGSWRLEFKLTDIEYASVPVALRLNALGGYFSIVNSSGNYSIDYVDQQAGYVAGATTRLYLNTRPNILVRIQRDVENLRYTMEVWDPDGTNYKSAIIPISQVGPGSSNHLSSLGQMGGQLGFLRVFTTVLPVGSKPPTTAETGDWANWKFDGDGKDSSTRGNANINTSGFSFVQTPGQGVFAVPRAQLNQKSFVERPLRAGHPSKLYGTSSFSMADGSNEVACMWQQLPHEEGEPVTSTVIFEDRTSCTPTVTGLVFGPYKFRLTVRDVNGATDTKDVEIGAVAWDENCVVIYPDERLYTILGPQLASGCNPWAYAENRFDAQSRELANGYAVNGGTWQMPSLKPDVNGLELTGTVYWTETGLHRTIHGIGTNFLNVFCGGKAGPANNEWLVVHVPETTWGDVLRPTMHFVRNCTSDTEIQVQTWLEAHLPITLDSPGRSWYVWNHSLHPGDVQGRVYVANGSTTVYGTGTDLRQLFCEGGATPRAGAGIRIQDASAMHFNAVASCVSATEITLTAPFAGTTVSAPGNGYLPSWNSTSLGSWNLTGSETVQWYDNAGAHYRHYFASGWYRSLKAARYLVRVNPFNPYNFQWSGLWETQFSPMLAAIIDPEAWGEGVENPWPWMVAKVDGADNSFGNFPGDQRSTAYAAWYIANLAQWHPEEATRNTMKDKLVAHYNLQVVPYQDPESGGYYTYYGDGDSRVWQVANGSTAASLVSGSNIDGSFCADRYNPGGTISIASDDVAITGSGTDFTGSGDKYIVLRGTLSGEPHIELSKIKASPSPTATSATLQWAWRGDDGSITNWWILNDANQWPVFSFERSDAGGTVPTPRKLEISTMYYCNYVSPTKIQLDHPYEGDTSGGNVYRKQIKENVYTYFPAWRQPFMDAMKASSFFMAYKALQGYNDTVANGFLEKMGDILNALWNDRDIVSGGQQYFRLSPTCKPYDFKRATICDQNPGVGTNERDYWLEAVFPMSMYYLETKNEADKTRFDSIYNLTYARPGWASPFKSDGHYSGWLNTIGWKKHGQANGVGGGATWPAARLGGVSNPQYMPVSIAFDPTLVPNAASLVFHLHFPSGERREIQCSSSPCTIEIDRRQGQHLVRIEYLSGAGKRLALSEWSVIGNPGQADDN